MPGLTQTGSGSPSSNAMADAFARNVGSSGVLPAALQALWPTIQKHGYKIQDGGLIIPLKKDYMSVAPSIVRVVSENPELKSVIRFEDKGRLRSYDDVVWNVCERGLELARLAYSQRNNKNQDIRIVVTPPVLGIHSGATSNLHCGNISVVDANQKNMTLVTHIKAEDNFGYPYAWKKVTEHRGKTHMVQTDRIGLDGLESLNEGDPVLHINLTARPACSQEINLPVQNAGTSHDFQF